MKVTGYQLREALRQHTSRRHLADSTFKESLWHFPGDEIVKPAELAEQYENADKAIAHLQSAQQEFNLKTEIKVMGQSMSLAEGIKRVGGAGRLEKMWQTAAGDTGRDRYSYRERTRKADEVSSVRSIPVKECAANAERASRFASALRSAIAQANSRTMEIPWLKADLLSE